MDKQIIAKTLKTLKENSPKRNFKQSIDLIINLKDIDLKKTEQQINMFVTLHHDIGKKVSVCALVGPELQENAKEVCDEVVLADQFDKFKGKKELKKLANKHDFFVSQANIMPKVATVFGRFLGPRGKMPNPKMGGVLPPNANIKPLYEKLKKTVLLATKNEPVVRCMVGKEDTNEEHVVDNILTIYNSIVQKLPNEKQNVKSVVLKYTMSPAFKIGEEQKEDIKKAKSKKKEIIRETKEKTEQKIKEKTAKEEDKEAKESEESKKETKSKKSENQEQKPKSNKEKSKKE